MPLLRCGPLFRTALDSHNDPITKTNERVGQVASKDFLGKIILDFPISFQYWDGFLYLFYLLFGDFVQLQKFMWGLK